MGRGDRKTRKGKIWRGSYGKTRKHAPVGHDASGGKTTSPPRQKKR